MKTGLMNQDLTVDTYEEYIDKIVNIFRLSSKKSSILFDMKIQNYQAKIKLSILNQNGEREKYHDVVLNCDYAFYHDFLMKLITKIYDSGDIATRDVVRLSESDLVTFRMITTNNDLLCVDGLSNDDAKALLDMCPEKKEEGKKLLKVPNHEGKGSFWIILFLMTLLFIILGIVILFLHS